MKVALWSVVYTHGIVCALLFASMVGGCKGSLLYEKAVPYYAKDVVWMTDCECDCPAVNTVHEKIKQTENATILLLSVTQPCSGGNIDVQDFNLYFDDTGLLFVEANISRGYKTSISRQYQTPPTADIESIKAIYTQDKVLEVTIPYLAKSQIGRYKIKVTSEPNTKENDFKSTSEKPPTTEKKTHDTNKRAASERTTAGSAKNPLDTKKEAPARATAVKSAVAKEIQVHDEARPVRDLDHEVDLFMVWDDLHSVTHRAPGDVKGISVDQGKVKRVPRKKEKEGANIAYLDKTEDDNAVKPQAANVARLEKNHIKVLDMSQDAEIKVREVSGKPANSVSRLEKEKVQVRDVAEERNEMVGLGGAAKTADDQAQDPHVTKSVVTAEVAVLAQDHDLPDSVVVKDASDSVAEHQDPSVPDPVAVQRQIEILEDQLREIQSAIRGELLPA